MTIEGHRLEGLPKEDAPPMTMRNNMPQDKEGEITTVDHECGSDLYTKTTIGTCFNTAKRQVQITNTNNSIKLATHGQQAIEVLINPWLMRKCWLVGSSNIS